MGFRQQDKCNGTSSTTTTFRTKKMVNNFVHSFNSSMSMFGGGGNHNSGTGGGGGGLLNHLRSWHKSKKIFMLNKNSSSASTAPIGHMNNLCYQSVSINSLDHQMPLNHHYYHFCTNRMRSSRSSAPIAVSYKNNKDGGKIALNLKHQALLNENQLYSMDLVPRTAIFRNDNQDRLKRSLADFSCYVSLDPPPGGQESMALRGKPQQQPNDPLNNETWYYGSICREQAIDLICHCPTGSFVVRRSTSKDGCYALTVRVPHDYNHTGVAHYLIQRTDDGKYKIKGFHKDFHTITSLITHHSIMKEQLPCTLRLIGTTSSRPHHRSNISSSGDKPLFVGSSPLSPAASSSINYTYSCSNNNNVGAMIPSHTLAPSSSTTSSSSSASFDPDDRMVDVDLDPTYQIILENFRKAMTHCN